jgi:hypothetical protein
MTMPIIHVIPKDDLIAHTEDSDDCICGPDVEWACGSAIVTHHALDRRP